MIKRTQAFKTSLIHYTCQLYFWCTDTQIFCLWLWNILKSINVFVVLIYSSFATVKPRFTTAKLKIQYSYIHSNAILTIKNVFLHILSCLFLNIYGNKSDVLLEVNYPLANEVAKGYSNASTRPSFYLSFRNSLVNTLESTSFNGFWPNLVHT